MHKKENNLTELDFEFEALEKCPLCGEKVMIPNGKINWLESDFWYVVCPSCGLKFMNPRPTQSSYKKFYKNQFWQQKIRNKGFHKTGQIWNKGKYKWDNEEDWDPEFGRHNLQEKLKSLRIEIITNALRDNITLSKDTRILEVGSAFPVTLESLRENFKCKVFAIEPSEEAQNEIQRLKISLIGSYGEELEEIGKKEKFDAIIFSHALENTSVPFDIMKFARNALTKKGIIYVQCSNLHTYDQMNPYHPYIFSYSSLLYLAEKIGMKYNRISEGTDKMLTGIFTQ